MTSMSKYKNIVKTLKKNNDFNTFSNVLSIVETIRHQRLTKLFNIAVGYLYHHTQEEDLDKLTEYAPNLISSEVALLRDIIKSLQKHDHYLTSECEYLKKK